MLLDVACTVQTIHALPGGASLIVPADVSDGAWIMVPSEGIPDTTALSLALNWLGYYADTYEDVRYLGDYMLVKAYQYDDEEVACNSSLPDQRGTSQSMEATAQ